MKLTRKQQTILDRLSASGDLDFASLIRIAGFDPLRDFRGADLSGVTFGKIDLGAFDLADADLSHADLSQATVTRRAIAESTLVGAKFPEAWPLAEHQLDALMNIIDHLHHIRRRALVSMPPGSGVFGIVTELVGYLAEDDPNTLGLVLCSSRASADQCRMRLNQQGEVVAKTLSDIRPGVEAAKWYVATYRGAEQALTRPNSDLRGVFRSFTDVIFAEADHASAITISSLLSITEKASQVCFISRRSDARSRRLVEYFEHDHVHELTDEEARKYGLLRPYELHSMGFPTLDVSQSHELSIPETRRAADALFGFLLKTDRLEAKTVVLCASSQQVDVVNDALNYAYSRHADTYSGPFELKRWAVRPHTLSDLREILTNRASPPFVACCRTTSGGEAFDASPDVVAVLTKGLTHRARQLWTSARPVRNDVSKPMLVLDYGGSVARHGT